MGSGVGETRRFVYMGGGKEVTIYQHLSVELSTVGLSQTVANFAVSLSMFSSSKSMTNLRRVTFVEMELNIMK